ncbi:MAG: DUF6783 domain-containing protein [Ruminococcus sp.]
MCGRFCPDEGAVAGYGNRIRAKYTAKWGVQIAGMIFQTRSNIVLEYIFSSRLIFSLSSGTKWLSLSIVITARPPLVSRAK